MFAKPNEIAIASPSLPWQDLDQQGADGRWRDTLSAAEIAAYDAMALKGLGPAYAK